MLREVVCQICSGSHQTAQHDAIVKSTEKLKEGRRRTDAQLIARAKQMVADLLRLPDEMRHENLEWYKDNLERYSKLAEDRGSVDHDDQGIDYVGEYDHYGSIDFFDLIHFLPMDIKRPELTSDNVENISNLLEDNRLDAESKIRKFCDLIFGEKSKKITLDQITRAVQLYQDHATKYKVPPSEIDLYEILKPVEGSQNG